MPLAPGMKEKLLHRNDVDLPNRKANEYNIRKYILRYFKDMEEIILLLDALPQKQVTKLLENGDAAKIGMDLTEKILSKMELPHIQANHLATEIKAVERFDLGKDNMRFSSHEGREMAFQPIGCSVSCDLTESEAQMIERLLEHIRTVKKVLISDREKISRKKFNDIESRIYDESKEKSVVCHTEIDLVEPDCSLECLLKTAANVKERREAAAMMQPPE